MDRVATSILVCASLLGVAAVAHATSIMAPYPYAVTSPSGRFYFTMAARGVRAPHNKPAVVEESWRGSRVTVYRVDEGGSSKELWHTEMDYAYPDELYFPDGGRHLIRFLAWPNGYGSSRQDSVLTFYKSGRVVKSYSSADLIVNVDSVKFGTRDFHLGRGKPEFVRGGEMVHQIRIGIAGGGEYVFDYDTGAIVAVVKDSPK